MIKKSTAVPSIAPLQKAVTRTVYAADIRVLVVDDEHDSRAMKVGALRLGGFDVIEADGIGSALASLQESPVDVLVLDMYMPNPEGDADDAGLVVLREIANSAVKPNVIVFTPGVAAQQARAARKLGAFIVLNKARDVRQLPIQVCAAWLRRLDDSQEKSASPPRRRRRERRRHG